MGVFNPDFFPRALPKDLGEKKGDFLLSPKFRGPPICPMVFLWPGLPVNFGNFGPRPKNYWGELWGRSGLKTPSFSMVTFGPGGLGGRPNRFGEFGFPQKL